MVIILHVFFRSLDLFLRFTILNQYYRPRTSHGAKIRKVYKIFPTNSIRYKKHFFWPILQDLWNIFFKICLYLMEFLHTNNIQLVLWSQNIVLYANQPDKSSHFNQNRLKTKWCHVLHKLIYLLYYFRLFLGKKPNSHINSFMIKNHFIKAKSRVDLFWSRLSEFMSKKWNKFWAV